MTRKYNRDARGRFAGGGGGSKKASAAPPTRKAGTPPAKRRGLIPQRSAVSATKAKLAAKSSDPAVSPRSVSAQKGAVTKARSRLAAAKETGRRRISVASGGGILRRGRNRQRPQVITPEVVTSGGAGAARVPASQRPGSVTSTLRSALRGLAQADAQRIREIESITGMPIGAPRGRGRSRAPQLPGSGGAPKVSGTLRGSLRQLAQGDAQFYRELGQIAQSATPKLPGGKRKGGGRRRLPGR